MKNNNYLRSYALKYKSTSQYLPGSIWDDLNFNFFCNVENKSPKKTGNSSAYISVNNRLHKF